MSARTHARILAFASVGRRSIDIGLPQEMGTPGLEWKYVGPPIPGPALSGVRLNQTNVPRGLWCSHEWF